MNRAERRRDGRDCAPTRELLTGVGCRDCNADNYLVRDRAGHPLRIDVEHDDGCPVYRGVLPHPSHALVWDGPTGEQK